MTAKWGHNESKRGDELLRLMMSSTQPLPPSDDDRSSLRHRFVRLNPRFDRDETLTLLKVSNNIMHMYV